MTLKDKLSIVSKRLNLKYNIFLSLFLTFILIIVFASLTVYSFYTKSLSGMINNNIDHRRYSLDTDNVDVNLLNNINHIEAIYDTKYLGEIYVPNNVLGINGLDGTIYLAPIIKESDIYSSSNKTIKPTDTGKAICPKSFYPNTNTYDKINIFKILDGKKFINKKFNVENIEFKIIDTYDSNYYYTSKNTCYISFNDFKNLANIRNTSASEGYIIQIDNYKNVKEVLNELDKHEYKYSALATVSYDEIMPIKNTTLLLVIISLIIIFIASRIIILKKNQSIKKYYHTLKKLGYRNKEIKALSNIELLIIYIISLLISFLIFIAIFIIVKYFILTEFLSQSGSFKIPYLLITLFNLIVILYIDFINSLTINKVW